MSSGNDITPILLSNAPVFCSVLGESVPQFDERRLKIWRALSDLFLDTEATDFTFDYIARTVIETGYTPEEMQQILWEEVYPILESNLRSVAGEWAGWSDEWLLEHIKVSNRGKSIQGTKSVIIEIKRCWAAVASRLPAGYAS